MAEPNYKKLSEILAECSFLERPEDSSQSPLYQDWQEAAGPAIAKNTDKLNADNGMLHVTVNSPNWAHKLINQQTRILAKMRAKGHEDLSEMTIRIFVPKPVTPPNITKPQILERKISPDLRQLFVRLASESNDPETSATFLRLSRARKHN